MVYNFTFNLTNDCNLNCSYCYQKNQIGENRELACTPMTMTIEKAKEIFDKIELDFSRSGKDFEYLRKYANNDKMPLIISVTFTGGEPTLNLDTMEYFINRFDRFSKSKPYDIRVSYSMATNCTKINELNALGEKTGVTFKIITTKTVTGDIDFSKYKNIKNTSYKVIIDTKDIGKNIDSIISTINSIEDNSTVDIRVVVDYIVDNQLEYDYDSYNTAINKLVSNIKPNNYSMVWHSKYRELPCSQFSYYAIDTDGTRKMCHRVFGTNSGNTNEFEYFNDSTLSYLDEKCVYATRLPEKRTKSIEYDSIVGKIGQYVRFKGGGISTFAMGDNGPCGGCA